MKVKLDENIPVSMAGILTGLGHETDTVFEQGLRGYSDADVWTAAQRSGAFFITQDLDFSDIGRFEPGTHAGLLLMRLREPGRRVLAARLRSVFEGENVEDWVGCFVVATDRKIRVRRRQR